MAEIADLAVLDASNIGRWPEGMLIPATNDSGRALEGMIARHHRDTSGYTLTGGTATAYTLLTQASYPAHAAGMVFMIRFSVACGDDPTLTINALAAKSLKGPGGTAIKSGQIALHQMGIVAYNASLDAYEVVGLGGTANEVSGAASFSSATSAAVTFATAQPDTAYQISVEPAGNYNVWITSKTTSGFTINTSSSITATLRWRVLR